MALLTGTVRYRPRPATKLPFGPVHARFGRDGIIDWIVDEAQMDPLLGAALAETTSAMLPILPTLLIRPTAVRWHRDKTMAGSQLLIADATSEIIHVQVPAELVTQEVADYVGKHATVVLRTLMESAPIIGENSGLP